MAQSSGSSLQSPFARSDMVSSSTPSGTKRGAHGSSGTGSAKRSTSDPRGTPSPVREGLPPLPLTPPQPLVPALPVVQQQSPQQQLSGTFSPQTSPQAISPFAQQGGASGPLSPGVSRGDPIAAQTERARNTVVPGENVNMQFVNQHLHMSYADSATMEVDKLFCVDVNMQADTMQFMHQSV